jgi:predicted ester cyclase
MVIDPMDLMCNHHLTPTRGGMETVNRNLNGAGFPSKNRKMTIQVVDIHEFKDGKIVRTWHTEDWMTGLRQLGIFEK